MGIDFDKIKRKVDQLSGKGRRKSSLWRPVEDVPSTVRLVPWPDGNGGEPFKERQFYYNIGNGPGILAPSQFRKPDPIQDLIDKLKNENNKDSYNLAKQFFPKRRYYAPVIVRGEEDEGVRIWGFGKTVAQDLYQIMMDSDYGDITDPDMGHDIKVTLTKGDAEYAKTSIMARPAKGPFMPVPTGSKKEVQDAKSKNAEILSEVADLDDIYKLIPFEEIEKRVQEHLGLDEDGSEESGDDTGTELSGGNDSSVGHEVSSEEKESLDSVFKELEGVVESV